MSKLKLASPSSAATCRRTRFLLPSGATFLVLVVLALLSITAQAQTQSKSQPQRRPAPPDTKQLVTAAETAHTAGRLEEAIQIYQRVIAVSTGMPTTAATAYLRIGEIYMAQRKFEQAAGSFQTAATLNPRSAEAFNNLGEALGELKQFTKAIEAFNRAAGLDSKLLKARYNQGVTYDRMGNRRYSEFVFKTLIKNAPDYPLAYDGLAVTLSKSGRASEAIPYHEKAISLNPNDASYYFNLGISYLMLGNTAKAVEQQEKLKKLDPRIADQLASVIVKRQLR